MRRVSERAERPPRRRSWRRHVASLVLLIGALLIGNYVCVTRDRLASIEIRYRLGDPPAARSLVVEVRPRGRGEVVATFRREGPLPETVHRTRLAPGLYDLEITVQADGRTRTVVRPIEARRDGVVTVDLSGERP